MLSISSVKHTFHKRKLTDKIKEIHNGTSPDPSYTFSAKSQQYYSHYLLLRQRLTNIKNSTVRNFEFQH